MSGGLYANSGQFNNFQIEFLSHQFQMYSGALIKAQNLLSPTQRIMFRVSLVLLCLCRSFMRLTRMPVNPGLQQHFQPTITQQRCSGCVKTA